MPTTVQINLVDRSAERSSVRIPTMDLGVGTIASLQAFQTSLESAVEALSLMSATGSSMNQVTRQAYTLPTDENAHREMAVRFIMIDVNLNQASFSLPGPNLALFPFTIGEGGDVYEWDSAAQSTELETLVTAVTNVARHPISGEALTMLRLELIGRNN